MVTMAEMAALLAAHPELADSRVRSFDLGGRHFAGEAGAALMGVINLSADSWYRETVLLDVDAAVRRGRRYAIEGAALVDVGAESTLPNAAIIDAAGQQSMLLPVVDGLVANNVAVSVETYHADVAEAVLQRGAAVINLTGKEGSDDIFRLVAKHDAAVIICYVAGENVRQVQRLPDQAELFGLREAYFAQAIERATSLGVEKLWIDPGLGFYYANSMDGGERVRYQIDTFLNTFRLKRLGWPICHALPHAFHLFEDEVRSAEAFFAVLAMLGQTHLLRTHEIARVRPVVEAMKL